MNLQRLIHEHMKDLSELECDILYYIVEHPEEVSGLSIVELAEKVHSSKSSILRLTKKIGFSGYSELKYSLKLEQQQQQAKETEQENFENQLDDIQQTLKYLQSITLVPINELLDRSKIIYCYATGFMQKKPLEEFAMTMLSVGKHCIVLSNKSELDDTMPYITEKDCVLIASISGEREDIKENLTTFRLRRIPVIAITASGNNYFARNSTHHLNYYCTPLITGRKDKVSYSIVTLHFLMDYVYRSYLNYINFRSK